MLKTTSYRVRTKVLTKFNCNLDLLTQECIDVLLLPSWICVWNMKAVENYSSHHVRVFFGVLSLPPTLVRTPKEVINLLTIRGAPSHSWQPDSNLWPFHLSSKVLHLPVRPQSQLSMTFTFSTSSPKHFMSNGKWILVFYGISLCNVTDLKRPFSNPESCL